MPGIIGACKLCGLQKKLIKAHIIPECFQSSLKDDNNSMAVLHLKNDNRVQIVNDFMFDKEVLCIECDGTFSHAENYTSRFLEDIKNGTLKPLKHTSDSQGNRDLFYSANSYLIKNCLLSILWRMSISTRFHFSTVSLGANEEVLKRMLNETQILSPDFFPFTIFSLRSLDNLKAKGMSPVVPKFLYKSIDTYVLHIPEYLIFFYASEHVPITLGLTSIKDDKLVVIGEEKGTNLSIYFQRIYPSLPDNPRK